MRARFAYISSLGTTAILVAAALLMLAVVSAIVAFRGWPGGAQDTGGVRAVPLAPGGAANRVALVRRAPSTAKGVERSAKPRTRTVARSAPTTAGLVKAKASGPRVVPGLVMVPVASSPMQPQPSSPGHPPQQQQAQPAADPAPERTVPEGPAGPGPVPGTELIPVPLPEVSPPPPSSEQVTTMVGTLLSGGSPPPPVLAGGIDGVASSVTGSVLSLP